MTSPGASTTVCQWCRRDLANDRSPRRRFCSRKCRQAAFRLRKRSQLLEATDQPLVFAYADPPYPGSARKYYGEPEVDHPALIASLLQRYDGWALSTSARSLRELLPLCPETARVCAWVKPIGVSSKTFGLHNTWEPLIVVCGRRLRPGFRDWLSAHPARHGGTLPGRKPLAFCAWLFRCLGMGPGDELHDLFPGTGIVARAWAELGGPVSSLLEERRRSATDPNDTRSSSTTSRYPSDADRGERRSSGYPSDAVAGGPR